MNQLTVKYVQLFPLSDFVAVQHDERLGPALARTHSSHEGVFVFNGEAFAGIVSAYPALFKNRYPYVSNVSSCSFRPPHITKDTAIYAVAEHMVFSKIYTLPVFDEDNTILGVITAETLLNYILNKPKLLEAVVKHITIQKPITTNLHETLTKVYQLMRTLKISRVPLVDDRNMLQAIISWKDIEDAFIAKTVHQRYSTREHYPVHSSFDVEDVTRRDAPLMEFATSRVATAQSNMSIPEIVRLLTRSTKHSIIIVEDGHPTGFLSRHDILLALLMLKPKTDVPIVWTKHLDTLKEYRLHDPYELLEHFVETFHKRYPIRRIEIHIDQPRNAAGYPKQQYITKLHILLKSGAVLLATGENHKLTASLRKALDKIKHEVYMSDRQRYKTAIKS